MSEKPSVPFRSVEDIKRDLEAMENNEAVWTPEWMQAALMSVWQDGQLKGNTDGYFGTNTARNPFMTEDELKAWYE
ncbi:hypothetical protein IRJ34_07220 [Paenarthrobacter sp. GOM3]|uniref:hypothetical protein n=1 Tax=Paenarthrobacter sp. GOM3 TaxID=2782567 RepID=UPI001BA906AD|nr:hypothetical protein [Paenarthrobacter sp. GOM3]WOH20106.1 hypothetical protein IRJ34_07220 [Paenarthrobacter sp. GOM3]